MFRALFFAIKVGLLAVAAFWIAQRPGTVQIEWLDYNIKAHIGLVLLALLVLLLFILFLHRVLLGIGALPGKWKKHRTHKQHEKGYKALTQGLTAVAAGDAGQAEDKARKTREFWPEDKGLSLLLEAQAARLRGEEDVARSCFNKLLENKDTAFLGLRGQMVNALEAGETGRALELAQRAESMHPRQPWIIRMLYDLAIQERKWELAEQTLKKAVKVNAFEARNVTRDQIAILIARAEDEQEKGDPKKALKWLKAAHKLDHSFVPAAQRLAEYYLQRGRKHHAKSVVQECWKHSPHHDLVPLWAALAPDPKKDDGGQERLRWFEKLVADHPESVEAQLAAAQVALKNELWGEARQYLHMAEQLQPSARLYRLYARLEEELGHTEDANAWLEKAAEAPPDKVWTCKETGRIYERWAPVAPPHGSFNTMIWDYPQAQHVLGTHTMLPQNELLITGR